MYTPKALRLIGNYLALPLILPHLGEQLWSISLMFPSLVLVVVLDLPSCASMLEVAERVGHAIDQHHESKDDRDNLVTETPEQYFINTMLAMEEMEVWTRPWTPAARIEAQGNIPMSSSGQLSCCL